MKNFIKKLIALTLTAVVTLSLFGGCGGEEGPKNKLPEYTNGREFNFFTYTAPTNGYYTHDGVQYFTEDFQTVERYKEYKDAGLNMLMLTGASGYGGGEWEKSPAYKCFTNAYEAGIDKIILDDIRLTTLVYTMDIVGEEGLYSEEDANGDGVSDELTAYVKTCLETYYEQAGFYGVRLGDEPDYEYQVSFGHVYRAVKAAAKELGMDDIYIHLNLFPHFAPGGSDTFAKEYEDFEDAYRQYLEGFLRETKADRLAVDIYFFKGNKTFRAGTYGCLQIFQEACKKYGAEMSFCLQSFEGYNGTNCNYGLVDRACMTLELNTLVGLGVRDFIYYTYMPGVISSTTGSKSLNRGTFLGRDGKLSNIYYYAKESNAEAQKLAPVITNYEFQGSRLYTCDDPLTQTNPTVASFDYTPYFVSGLDTATNTVIEYKNVYKFSKVKSVNIDNDIAFMTELYDDENDLYMYMAQNVVDPRNGAMGRTDMNVTIEFDGYEWVAQFEDGNLSYVKLEDGVYTKTLSAGYAVYLIPLN